MNDLRRTVPAVSKSTVSAKKKIIFYGRRLSLKSVNLLLRLKNSFIDKCYATPFFSSRQKEKNLEYSRHNDNYGIIQLKLKGKKERTEIAI